MRKIIGIGETVLDIIFKNDSPSAAVPGGSTFNSMISLGRTVPKSFSGIPVYMVTEVGDDHVSDIVMSFLEDNGVNSSLVVRNEGSKTPVSLAFLNEKNDASYEFYRDILPTRLSEDVLSGLEFKRNDIVMFGSFFAINPVIRPFTLRLLEKARQSGAILYYDINFRPSHLKDLPATIHNIEENCRLADFVRGSSEDFECLYGTSDGRSVYYDRVGKLCRNLILTRSSDPVEIYTPSLECSFPVEKVKTVSTIGAGDNFNAGFVYSMLSLELTREGIPSLDATTFGTMVGTATRFSAAVCQSVFNYVDRDFEVR